MNGISGRSLLQIVFINLSLFSLFSWLFIQYLLQGFVTQVLNLTNDKRSPQGAQTGYYSIQNWIKTENSYERIMQGAITSVFISFFLIKAGSIENGQICLLLPWLISSWGINTQLVSVTAILVKAHWNLLGSCQCFCLSFLGWCCRNPAIDWVILWFTFFVVVVAFCPVAQAKIVLLPSFGYECLKGGKYQMHWWMICICGCLPCTLAQGRKKKNILFVIA